MKRRILSILLVLAMCLTLLPTMVLADGDDDTGTGTETTAAMTVCGVAWTASTYAKTEAGEVKTVTDGTDENGYNIYWNADTATLTLNGANISVKDVDAISAEVEKLTIKLIGKNTITAEHSAGSSKDENLSAISNSGEIVIQPEGDDASLTIEVSQTGTLSSSKVAGIYTGTGLTNSATLSIEVTANAEIACSGNLSGIEGGAYENGPGLLSSAFLKNSGDITIRVENQSLSAGSGANAYAVLLYGGVLENSGNLNVTVSATNGKAYGLRGTDTANAPWKNEGEIVSNVTAYGGNYEKFLSSTQGGSNHACAISISTNTKVEFTNTNTGTLNLTAQNYGDNKYAEYAIGLQLEGTSVIADNAGTIEIKAYDGYTWGIIFNSIKEDSSFTNSGNITIEATTDGRGDGDQIGDGCATGIGMNTVSKLSAPVKLELILENGSSLYISTHAVEGIENADEVTENLCQAIQLQKMLADTQYYAENLPQEITIADDLIVQEGGEPFTVVLDGDEYAVVIRLYGYVYINTIGYNEDEGPAKTVIILPQLPGGVAITGTAQVGQTLTAETSGIPEGVEVSYQWQSCDTADGEFIDIDGATGDTYTLTSADTGKYIRVVITPAAGSGYAGTLTASTTKSVSMPYIPTYTPTVEPSDNGTTSVTPKNPRQGAKVTIVTAPDEGFEVDSVTVTDRNGKPVAVTDNGDGTYSFTQPAGKVTISVTYKEIYVPCDGGVNCPAYHFTDVDTSEWYHEAVDYVVEIGLMIGTSATTFEPNATTTRAMLVTVLYRLENEPEVSSGGIFDDVPEGEYYSEAVAWAAVNGIVNGYGDGTFGPDDILTREQMAAIMFRYAKYKGYDVSDRANLSDYIDAAEISDYAVDAMAWVNAAGIINGTSETTLEPVGDATRCQFAAILYRFCENVAE